MHLRDGSETNDPRLDCLEDKDERSRAFAVRDWLGDDHNRAPRSYTWSNEVQLDQGPTGACVGFAWTHELTARPARVRGIGADFARQTIYFAAQRIDRFRGGAYPGAFPFAEGTSVLAAAKVVKALGYIDEYRWAFDVDDLLRAVGFRGPAVFGCDWHKGMQNPTQQARLEPTGGRLGKHCVLLYGTKIVHADGGVDEQRSFFKVQNSFGVDWGLRGRGTISVAAIRRLWPGAETCVPVVRRRVAKGGRE